MVNTSHFQVWKPYFKKLSNADPTYLITIITREEASAVEQT
jgi:hypothetical protein